MWPWAHLALGYLLYTAFVHLWARQTPDGYATVVMMFGTQFPDFVDKPLAWTFGVIPNGRSLTHSLITAVLLIAVIEVLLRRRGNGPIATAFAVGYLSHLLGDALSPVLSSDFYLIGFLGWPVVSPVEYSTDPSFTAHLRDLTLSSLGPLQLTFAVAALLVWLLDGAPGWGVVTAIPRWVGRKLVA